LNTQTARHCSRREGQQDGALNRHRSVRRDKSRREGAGEDRQIPGSDMRTGEGLESRIWSDHDSGRRSGNNTQEPGEELDKNRNNSKRGVASESWTTENSTNTQKLCIQYTNYAKTTCL